MPLRALGFCGADDSVHPHMLVLMAQSYPLVEFGVLFRPDKEGTPRYASKQWVERLAACKPPNMLLAAHLCGARVNDLLQGKSDGFLKQLQEWGFQRIQINATAVNGVDTSKLDQSVETVASTMRRFSGLEFILQKNEETKPLWNGLLLHIDTLPSNISMLVDESKGTGALNTSWPQASSYSFPIGYAGGFGPDNIEEVLGTVDKAAQDKQVWIDMESRLRSIKNGQDTFDLDKCYLVVDAACRHGAMSHPEFLQS